MSEIKLYKLLSGQEIIGRVVEEGPGWVVLENVLAFRVVQQGPDQYGLDMVPHSPVLPEHKWKYFTSAFMGEPAAPLPDGLQKAYVQRTSSIQIASSMDDVKVIKP